MLALFRRIAGRFRQFRLVEEGAAAVEFALILPFMLMLYIGAAEGGTLITMDRRVQSVAGTVGDLVARSNGTISASTLTDYFRASGGIITPFSSTGLKQIVTQVAVANNGSTTVTWSREYLNGTYKVGTDYPANSTNFVLPAAMIAISKGKSVIVARASYSYLPLYGIVFNTPISLSRENYFLPRFGAPISIN